MKRQTYSLILALAAALAGLLSAGAALAQATPTRSVQEADDKLARVAHNRAAINAEFAASEKVCYGKFFTNRCLDQAKEKRRAALAVERAIEVEASHYKRQDAVDKRDAELAERLRKDEQEQQLRAAQPPKPAKAAEQAPKAPPSGPSLAERQAQHDARAKRQAAEDAANAGQRAANVAAYQRKQEETAKRQAEVKRKMEENARKKAEREEAERKRAAQEAAAAAAAAKR